MAYIPLSQRQQEDDDNNNEQQSQQQSGTYTPLSQRQQEAQQQTVETQDVNQQQQTQSSGTYTPLSQRQSSTTPNINQQQSGQPSLAVRNNNPGNLRFAGQRGAEPGEAGFARFESPEEGFRALKRDIAAKVTGATSTGLGPNSTIRDFAETYAPEEDNNDPEQYAKVVSQQLGVSPDANIGQFQDQLNDFAIAVANMEDHTFPLEVEQSARMSSPEEDLQPAEDVFDQDRSIKDISQKFLVGSGNLGETLSEGVVSPIETGGQIIEGVQSNVLGATSAFQRGAASSLFQLADVSESVTNSLGIANMNAEDTLAGEAARALDRWASENQQMQEDINRAEQLNNVEEDDRSLVEKLNDPEYVFGDMIGANLPFLASTTAGGVTGGIVGGPAGAAAGAGAVGVTGEQGAAINRAKEQLENSDSEEFQELANDQDFLNSIGNATGIMAGMLEAMPVVRWLNDTPVGRQLNKSIMQRAVSRLANVGAGVVKQGGSEAGTETMQEIAANSVEQVYNENKKLVDEQVAEAGVSGLLTGGGMGAASGVSVRGLETERVDSDLRDKSTEETIDKLIERRPAKEEDLRVLKSEYQRIKEETDNEKAKQLSKRGYVNQDGELPEVTGNESDGEFAANGQEIVEEIGYDSVAEAREDVSKYVEKRRAMKDIDNALSRGSFSTRQLLNRVDNAHKKGRQEGFKEARSEIRQQIRDEQADIETTVSNITKFARNNLPKSRMSKLVTDLKNTMEKREGDAKKRALRDGYQRIVEEAKDFRKERIASDVQRIKDRIENSGVVDLDYKERAQERVEDVDFVQMTEQKRQELESRREFVEQRREEGKPVPVPTKKLEELERLEKDYYKDLPLDALNGLLADLEMDYKLGRLKNQLGANKRQRKVRNILTEIAEDDTVENMDFAEDNSPDPPGEGQPTSKVWMNKIRELANKFRRGDVYLSFSDNVFRRMGDKTKTYFKDVVDYKYDRFLNRFDDAVKEVKDLASDNDLDVDNMERIAIRAIDQQENGREKLLSTGYSEEVIDDITLNDGEQQLLDKMREQMDALFPEVKENVKELYNRDLEKNDMYFPFLTDANAMSELEIQQKLGYDDMPANNILEGNKQGGDRLRKNVDTEAANERTGDTEQKVQTNAMEVYKRHMSNTLYFLEMAEDIQVLTEVAKSDKFRENVGSFGQQWTLQYLDTLARQGGGGKVTRSIDVLRQNTSSAVIGYKLSTILLQFSSLMDGAQEIGGGSMAQGILRLASSDWRNFVTKMPEVRNRFAGETDIKDFQDEGASITSKIKNSAFKPLQLVDGKIVAAATAIGAYRKYAKENDIQVDLTSEPNQEAMQYAQHAVRSTQSTSEFKDVPQIISRGAMSGNRSFDRLIFQFQNYSLAQWNRFRYDLMGAGADVIRGKNSKENAIRAARTFTYMTLARLMAGGMRVAHDEIEELIAGEDDESEDDIRTRVYKEALGETLQTFPMVSNANSVFNYGGSGIPSLDLARDIAQDSKGVYDNATFGDREGAAQDLAKVVTGFAGSYFGMPGTLQTQSMIEGALEDRANRSRGSSIAPTPPTPPAPPTP